MVGYPVGLDLVMAAAGRGPGSAVGGVRSCSLTLSFFLNTRVKIRMPRSVCCALFTKRTRRTKRTQSLASFTCENLEIKRRIMENEQLSGLVWAAARARATLSAVGSSAAGVAGGGGMCRSAMS